MLLGDNINMSYPILFNAQYLFFVSICDWQVAPVKVLPNNFQPARQTNFLVRSPLQVTNAFLTRHGQRPAHSRHNLGAWQGQDKNWKLLL